MATTDQIRKWYHNGVVLNHSQRGTGGYTPRCNHDHPKVAFPNSVGGVYNEPVHPLTVEAWEAYIMVMNHHGETMPPNGGVNFCRNIGDSDWPSLHAYLCAVDLPPNSRKSAAFIGDMGRIRTNNGAFVFRNLAGDRMHDQINCSPADLTTRIDPTTVIGADMPLTQADFDKIRAIQREEINLHFGPAWTPTSGPSKGRRFVKALVDSTWWARSMGRATLETLDETHDYAKKASEHESDGGGPSSGTWKST